jgi:hypothetical protein
MIDKINTTIQDKDALNFVDTLQAVTTASLEKFDFQSNVNNVFQSIDHTYRLLRYSNSEEICDSITYCARSIEVIRDGVISPDDVSKRSLQILLNDNENTTTKDKITFSDVKDIIDEVKLEEILPEVIGETLKLGDQFVEIADYNSSDVPLTQSLLNESGEAITDEGVLCSWFNENDTDKKLEAKIHLEVVQSSDHGSDKLANVVDNIIQEKDVTPTELTASKEKTDIKNIRLIVHDPRFVVKLQSKRYKMSLGYLVLPEVDINNGMFPSSNGTSNKTLQTYSTMNSINPMDNHLVNGVDRLYLDLLSVIKKNIEKEDLSINQKEVKDILSRVIRELDPTNTDGGQSNAHRLRVRYVPEHRMEHWRVRSKRFFPYGESLLYKTTFTAKLYILLQTCATIKRITDSTDRRIIYLETDLRRDIRSQITEIQNAFQKRTQSIDSFGSIASIPSALTTFETIFVPVINGKKTLEFDRLEPSVQMRDVTEELKAFRDTVVASLPVPPPYLNIEENISNKASLAFENGLFAQTLISLQQMFSVHLKNMVTKIFKMTKSAEFPKNITVTFNPPKMLQMEREVERIDMLTRQVQGLVDFGVPKEYVVRNMVDVGIDWDKVDQFKAREVLNNKLYRKVDPMAMGMDVGGMGGMGGMGSGMDSTGMGGGLTSTM